MFVQTAVICTLAIISPDVDYWTALFIPLVAQVMHNYSQRTGFVITGIFTVIMTILMLLVFGLEMGLLLIFTYIGVNFLLAGFVALIREAEAAREESQKQQAELQSAYL